MLVSPAPADLGSDDELLVEATKEATMRIEDELNPDSIILDGGPAETNPHAGLHRYRDEDPELALRGLCVNHLALYRFTGELRRSRWGPSRSRLTRVFEWVGWMPIA